VLQSQLWQAAANALASPSLRLLVLNRNFPPNSWSSSLSKLRSAADASRRRVLPIAVLPQSFGAPTNAISLAELAVCLRSVQQRTGHAAQLDAASRDSCRVASIFYNCFRAPGPDHLLPSLRRLFTPRVAVVPWLRQDVVQRLPEALREVAWQVAQTRQQDFSPEMEAHVRHVLAHPDHVEYFNAVRLPVDAVAEAVVAQVRRQITSVPDVDGKSERKVPRFVSLDMDTVQSERVLAAAASSLPDMRAAVEERRGEELHVTLWFGERDGLGSLEALEALEGREFGVQLLATAADDVAAAVHVRLLPAQDGQAVPCYNQFPHVTVWNLPGRAVHSNTLLARLLSAEGGEGPGVLVALPERALVVGTVTPHY